MKNYVLNGRRDLYCFWLGTGAVSIGVALHIPMFLMGEHSGYRLAGMPMDDGMLIGMAMIVVGICITSYGLLPQNVGLLHPSVVNLSVTPPEDAPLVSAHWMLMAVLVAALIIDVMKPASLGFVVPGMRVEYGLDRAMVAWLPLSALVGTTLGSFAWGVLADLYGRRASILLSAIIFVGTSICGAMPGFWWNVGMCFLMGAAAGGMLPVTYALLAETMPSKHRGWSLVLVGGLGAVGGYFAASGLSSLLQPYFGWRIMWFLNLPTGLIVILLSGLIPESPKFLLMSGRLDQARATMRRYGSIVVSAASPLAEEPPLHSPIPPASGRYAGKTTAMSIAAISWGLINFGLLLWLPADLVSKHYSVALSSKLLAESALIALPTVFAATLMYSRWRTKWALVIAIGITALGLLGVIQLEATSDQSISPVLPVALLIIGSNGTIAMLLPYAAENYPLKIRGRATGWIAGCSKFGGLIAQLLSISSLVPALGVFALLIAAPTVLSMALIALFGAETRGRNLRELDAVTAVE
jgi:MFS transporter, putative metabolite:H+ symporter